MTCNGCRASVEQKLNGVDGVINATVDLESEEATIEMDSHIETARLNEALPDKYSITEKSINKDVFAGGSRDKAFAKAETEKSKLQQLKPLLIIIGYISVATLLLNYQRETWDQAMLDFMGLFFIVFSFFKILDLNGFPESFRMYDPLAKALPVYGRIYPFIETALGLMFLMRIEVTIALVATLIVLSITTIGVTKVLLSKRSIQCACLGTALKLPMTEATFIENAIMIIMAVVMLLSY
jgi:copper chaperone CopZ